MKRYILTGTPGSGKSTLLRALEMAGAPVVEEVATDLIAYRQNQGDKEPWKKPGFIDDIIWLQKHRQETTPNNSDAVQFFDRSPICTYALAKYLDSEPSASLMNNIKHLQETCFYDRQVFFIDNLGFIENTDARQISFEEALVFEKMHLEAYKKFGYECIHIPPAPVPERLKMIRKITNF